MRLRDLICARDRQGVVLPVALKAHRLHLHKATVCLLIMAGCCLAGKIRLESYASGYDTLPVMITAFNPQGLLNLRDDQAPDLIIASDLDFCGRFSVHRVAAFTPELAGVLKVDLRIAGGYHLTRDSLTIEMQLLDVETGDTVYATAIGGRADRSRQLAHRLSNNLFEFLFHDQGYFESRLLAVQDLAQGKSIIIMDYDGADPRVEVPGSTLNLFPCFAGPMQMLWISYQYGKPDLFKAALNRGASRSIVASRATETSPAYCPVQGLVTYASSLVDNLEIYVADSDGAEQRRLTFNKAIDTSPCWSPDGYQIAFISDRSGQPQVYIMDYEGANVRRVTFSGNYQDSPAWSPRGDLIAYTSMNSGKTDIWVVEVTGANPRRITSLPGKNEYPAWSPDGSRIAFQSTQGTATDIYCVRTDGEGLRRITTMGNVRMPDWEPLF